VLCEAVEHIPPAVDSHSVPGTHAGTEAGWLAGRQASRQGGHTHTSPRATHQPHALLQRRQQALELPQVVAEQQPPAAGLTPTQQVCIRQAHGAPRAAAALQRQAVQEGMAHSTFPIVSVARSKAAGAGQPLAAVDACTGTWDGSRGVWDLCQCAAPQCML
jgi:hypothetical protein